MEKTRQGVTLIDADDLIELEDLDNAMILDGEFEEIETEEEDSSVPEPIRKIVQQAERDAEAALQYVGETQA